jgi:hypothetical protein
MTERNLVGVMNDTKWDELRLAMYALQHLRPMWRTKDPDSGYICPWDGEWYHHFRGDGYESIEWVEIRTISNEQREAVRDRLKTIHVPGIETAEGFRLYGWVSPGETITFIN